MHTRAIILLLLATALSAAAQTTIDIVGMKSMSRDDVTQLIGGRFEYIRKQQASPARAADSAFMVEQLFRRNGYNDASVTWKVVSPNRIRLTITEGPREGLGTVTIEGVENEKLRKQLGDLFRLNPQKRMISSTGAPPLQDSDVEAGIELMKRQLSSIGFWKPEITVADRRVNPETGNTDFTLRVDAGSMHRIAAPVFKGEGSGELRSAVADYVNRPANTANINGMRLAATEYLRSRGYVNAKINMSVEISGGSVRPTFEVIRGKQFRLGEVTYEGLEKTKKSRVARLIDPLRGERIDGNRVDKRIRQLIATGAFSTVRTDTVEREGNILDATLHFEEAKARGISLTGGAGSYEGFILGASYYDRNFGGNLVNFSAGAEITQRSLLGEVTLTDPWLWGSDAQGQLRLYSLSQSNEGYENWRVGLEGSIRYPVSDHYSLGVTLGIATADTTPDGLPITRLGDTNYQNPYLRVDQMLDYRDSAVLPKEGWHLEVPLEFGAALGDSSVGYVGLGFASSYHLPIGSTGQLALGARASVVIPSGGDLPIDLRLFNGGARSVRSYQERELGLHDRTGYPVGGEASWVTNIEYIRPIAGALKGVVFVDAGGLSTNWEDFGFDEIEVALGLGLRLDLPIGPVRFEYGHNMTKEFGEPSGAWHFSIGTAF